MTPLPDAVLQADDIVLLEGDPDALERAVARADLELEGEDRPTAAKGPARRDRRHRGGGRAELDPDRPDGRAHDPARALQHQSARRQPQRPALHRAPARHQPAGRRRPRAARAISTQMPEKLRELGCLPLAEREIRLGNVRRGLDSDRGPGRRDGARGHGRAAGRHRILRARRC